jgi:SAM-dependent methyltransferase
MTEARYDAVADFYVQGFADASDDPVTLRLLELVGPLAGASVLDLACGHGRVTRELAARGARVVGLDISSSLLDTAEERERAEPLGARYVRADAAEHSWEEGTWFDTVVCNFGLSDIDDLDGAVARVAGVLRPGGTFVFSLLHPCFPGGPDVSGAWPADGTYYDEHWWKADGALSSLRRQVGANHRTLSTYVNTLRWHGLWLDELAEPEPPAAWVAAGRTDAARMPVFLVARCVKR